MNGVPNFLAPEKAKVLHQDGVDGQDVPNYGGYIKNEIPREGISEDSHVLIVSIKVEVDGAEKIGEKENYEEVFDDTDLFL